MLTRALALPLQVHQQLLRCTREYIAEQVDMLLTFDTTRQARVLRITVPELIDYYKADLGKDEYTRARWLVNHLPADHPGKDTFVQYANSNRTRMAVKAFDWSPLYRVQSPVM